MSTYQALLEQKKALDQRIAEARKAEAREALATVHALIAEFGFMAQQVFPWKPAARKAPARYRDPVTGATWSGRGKPPRWINGKDRAAFEI